LSFISSISLFLFTLSVIEFISIIFQSITITNRLSINVVAGGFLVNVLFLCLDLSVLADLWPWIDYRTLTSSFASSFIFDFEIVSLITQLCIFLVLSLVILH
jgi:F0F1-type ATP synthase membrane subunit a